MPGLHRLPTLQHCVARDPVGLSAVGADTSSRMTEPLLELRQALEQIVDVGMAIGLLGWDQRTQMHAVVPPSGRTRSAR